MSHAPCSGWWSNASLFSRATLPRRVRVRTPGCERRAETPGARPPGATTRMCSRSRPSDTAEAVGDGVVDLRRLEDPQWTCPPPPSSTSPEARSTSWSSTPTPRCSGWTTTSIPQCAPPGLRVPREVRVADRMLVPGLVDDDAGESLPASVDEVEPLVLAERLVMVVRRHVVEEQLQSFERFRTDLADDLARPHLMVATLAGMPDFRLDGKVALVTGGNSGIGRAIAIALAGARRARRDRGAQRRAQRGRGGRARRGRQGLHARRR